MRRNIIICAVLAASMILLPVFMLKDKKAVSTMKNEDFEYEEQGKISVMKSINGKVLTVDEREYLIGALAAEMDLSYHEEALKAQVVACYTYSVYVRENISSDDLNGAQISDDPQVHQGYITQEERKKKWGEKFDEYEKKAEKAVEAVYGKAIYYGGKPILAVYHDLNSGKTESSETVWKRKEPYLVQVESPGDRLSSKYSSKTELSYDDFEKLISKIDGVELSDNKDNWIGKVVKTESGYVKSVEICGDAISSEDFRSALGLKSCCFSISEEDDLIIIRTLGNGHMVGMSQYGADYMARQGADYVEILKFYYSDVEIR